MNLNTSKLIDKKVIFEQVEAELKKENFTVVKKDETRPWGGFFVIDEDQAALSLLGNNSEINTQITEPCPMA